MPSTSSLCRVLASVAAAMSLLSWRPVQAGATEASLAEPSGTDRASPAFGSGAPDHLDRHRHFGFVAPHHVERRRGLAVIADFADSRLEDWQGPGIDNAGDLARQLRKMEAHWAWLSRGGEAFQWNIIRVTLPVNLSADAYPGWAEYRDAVGALIRAQVDVAKYDLDQDGVIDSAWVIASNQGMNYDYLIGGASSNAGVNLFVDTQDSLSVVSGATGNFNHETAHTIGIPDLYGPYETLHYLTVMSDSWALPPQDFTAYERSLLDWVAPRRLARGSQEVRLSSSRRGMDAVRIDTSRPSEYFLVEYKRRPQAGFGSRAPAYDGVVVYHVLEGSNQWMDPPLLKLEAADGFIAADAAPDLDDFLFPDNPAMQLPRVFRSYFGGAEVFRINRLRTTGRDGMRVDVQVAPRVPPVNGMVNGSFERGLDSPAGWQASAWLPTSTFAWDAAVSRKGRRSVSISSGSPNDASWVQTQAQLVPGQAYEFCGWIRGEDIVTGPGAQIGANVSVMGGFVLSESLSGTFDWKQACVIFRPEATTATLACRLGFFGSTVTGRMWCDDMTLAPLRSAFD